MTGLARNDRECFYKYCSSDVALKIIEEQRLRWSSPLLFNDPFDHQAGFHWAFSGQEIGEHIAKRFMAIVFGSERYLPIVDTPTTRVLRLARTHVPRIPKREFAAMLQESAYELAARFPKLCSGLNEAVIQQMTNSRVICLTETNDNVVMWSHYGEEHKGAVFKFRRLEEEDHRFLIAAPVQYTAEPAEFASLEDYVEHLVGLKDIREVERIKALAYRKHQDWAYEREWRVHIPRLEKPETTPGVWYEKESPRLFEAIYLGCRASDEFTRAAVEAASTHLPDMAVYRAKARKEHMALGFERIH